jgi:hypothetical protein
LPEVRLRTTKSRLVAGGLASLASLVPLATPVAARAAAKIHTSKSCYAVGQAVHLTGSGFGDSRAFVVTIDGVYFGESTTSTSGVFSSTLRPGGLGSGVAQSVDQLEATDGNAVADSRFTVTRPTGARFISSGGSPDTLRAPFEVWGFSMTGARLPVYLHYVTPLGGVLRTVSLGHTGGQCGYLRTAPRKVFPFHPAVGTWTFQIDTQRTYAARSKGPVARIRVAVG